MTQQEALYYAISIIEQQPKSEINENAVSVLMKMAESCKYIKWTKETAKQALDNWKAEHGRNPSVTDLCEPDMPKGVTIKKLFDMKPSAFLNIYYPREHKKKSTTKYDLMSLEEYKNIFVEQYQKHKPTSSKQYDALRDTSTPSWNTIAIHCGLKTWNELLSFSKVERYGRVSDVSENRNYTVTAYSPTYEKMVKLLEEQKEYLDKITKVKL